MQTLLQIVHVIVSLFMILVILLQAGKSGGMGGLSGGSATVFGGRGSQTFLGKLTSACAAIFMITSLSLAYISSHLESDSAVLKATAAKPAEKPAEKPADAPAAAPAAPAGEAPAAPAAPAGEAPAAPAEAPKAVENPAEAPAKP